MEGITYLLAIGLIVAIYLINKLTKKIDVIDKKLGDVSDQIKRSSFLNQKVGASREQIKSIRSEEQVIQKPVVVKTIVEEPKKIQEPDPKEVLKNVSKPSVVETVKHAAAHKVVKVSKPKKPPKPSFMERNPDLEKFIGENLLSKIGIVIFVIGMGFLVKLGIDNEVITESMRVAIGILIGGGMIGLAHYLRSSFTNFSSILIGGALAVLYFTIALAFHEYGLIPQSASFIIMVTITAFGVLLAIAYDRKSLAVLAIIGGFGTPFFVSTGSGDFVVLFTYILILDIGMLALVYFKKWNIINYLAYGFTYLLFAGVYVSKYWFVSTSDGSVRLPLFLFLTAFYLIFFLMNIVYNVKNAKKFKYPEVIMLLSNSSLYFGFGLSLIYDYKSGLYSGIFTALVAIFNFVFAYTLYKRKGIDKNLLYLLIGLVLTFVSLIAPIQLKGNYITIFWSVESVLLLWLSQKSGIKIMRLSSLIVTVLMLVSLVMDWQQNYAPFYDYVVLPVFLNKVFITSSVVILSTFLMIKLMKEDVIVEIMKLQFAMKSIYIQVVFIAIVYLSLLLELNYQFLRFEFTDTLRLMLLGIYNYSFVIAILIMNRIKPTVWLGTVSFWLSAAVVVSYVTLFLSIVTISRDYDLMQAGINTGYYWHYLLLTLFLLILVDLYINIYNKYTFKSKEGKVTLYILSFIGVLIGSTEVGHMSLLSQQGAGVDYYEAFGVTVKSVYPIVWALIALVLMVVGMKFRLKPLRIASLVLFSVTIIKLFFYDLAGNSTGKIVSFILLGVILLLISFLYQKLKFIIQDDENKD